MIASYPGEIISLPQGSAALRTYKSWATAKVPSSVRKRSAGRVRRESLAQFLYENRNSCYTFADSPYKPASCGTLGGEAKGDRNFFYFFLRNPLKSPDSDE